MKPKSHGTDGDGNAGEAKNEDTTKADEASYTETYTYEESSEEEQDEKGDDEPEPEDPLKADSLEDYYNKRVFVFVHHFAGPNDPLSAAMRGEALRRGIKLKVISVEKESGTGDLLDAEPYTTHLRWATRGYIDAFHAGFPCSTFSKLRHRPVAGLPGPVRSKQEPYGLKQNTARQQESCDVGTILASRSIDIAAKVAESRKTSTIPAISTLENPPPSEVEGHLSAWELPEMRKFSEGPKRLIAQFNTCRFQPERRRGERHYKPQQFCGTLLGLPALSLLCNCGNATHEPIVGPDRSKASAEYPVKLCKEYAILAVEQLILVGKEEFLTSRMATLSEFIEKNKPGVVDRDSVQTSVPSVRPQRRRSSSSRRSKTSRADGDETAEEQPKKTRLVEVRSRSSTPRPASSGGRREHRSRSRTPPRTQVNLEPNKTSGLWKGGEGRYGSFKKIASKAADVKLEEFVGGLRDPYKVVLPRSNMLTIGLRIRAAWELFERQYKNAIVVGETYGTKECSLDDRLIQEWRARLKRVVGAQAPPAVRVQHKWIYKSPLQAEIIRAWIEKGNDPDKFIPDWIENGAPLGIERTIETAGIFPPNEDNANNLDYHGGSELEDAATQLERGELLNYTSVQDNVDEAKVELDRYRQAGYMVDVPKAIVQHEMTHGTISKLGLIIKEKPEGVKRRIILDLRRSGGNRKAQLPEKLVLPRPKDALETIRSVYTMRKAHGGGEGYARELVVIDISDAFMSLGLHKDELPHALAPNVSNDDFYMFSAMLFGFKTAPLVWSRVAALLARMLQSLVNGSEAQHQVYLDDSFWTLQGTLRERNSVLAMILTTMAALGFRVALNKGERSSQIEWIGIRFTITEDVVIMTIPDKFANELVELLRGWEGKGMAPLKELRQVCGKASWLSGVLPKARWLVSIFYGVLHDRLNDLASGEEDKRRLQREDQRNKSGLFAVKQLEQARVWMISFLGVAMERPTRKYKLDVGRYPKATVITDASPKGMGGILLINNRIVKAFAFKVTETDAKELGFLEAWGTSASQGIVETLAVLLALKVWKDQLSSCHLELQVQSDSMVALSTSQKLSNPTAALNFIGAEIAIQCEAAGVEGLRVTHIPGVANEVADYLSREDKWESVDKPKDLLNVPIQKDEGTRGADFYHLPTPHSAPGLWQSSATANQIWASLR